MESSLGFRGKIKVIALDFDGVITNLDIDWDRAIRLASKIAGYDIKSLLTFYEDSHGTPLFQSISKEMEKLESEALNNAELAPSILEFLEEVSKSGVEVYVVSMQTTLVVQKFLERNKIAHCFKEVLTREGFPSRKAQVNCIMTKSGISPNEILLVDDSKRNITKCEELGVRCFHLARRQDPHKTKETWNAIIDLVKWHSD
jgi:phosphoglycolate phosphatase-like HAD superfamily hydrolase